MKRKYLGYCAVAMMALPMTTFADVTGSPTLSVNTMINLDTGTTGATGGDLLWTGSQLTPQTGVVIGSVPGGGAALYGQLTQSTVSQLIALASFTPIPVNALTGNAVLIYRTRGGNVGKMLIASAASGGSLAFQFTTFGATGGTGPRITDIRNNYGEIPAGLPNYGIAPSTLFYVKGANLSNTTNSQSSASPGLKTTVDGVSVKVSVNGASFDCPLYYVSPTQINAVLPGAIPTPGTATVTVTNNGATSPAANMTVVASAFELVHYNSTLAAAYDGNNAILTTTNSANPGQTIALWGSGVGFDANSDDKLFPQKQDNLTNIPMQAFIGGVEATILYRGRSQFPGVDQVVVTIPNNVPVGCNVAVSVVSGSIVSNSVTIPIAASGRTCTDANGFPTGVLSGLAGKTSVKEGFLSVSQFTSINGTNSQTTSSVVGLFQNTSGFNTISGGVVSVNSCLLTNTIDTAGIILTGLDAGTSVAVTGPAGSTTLNPIAAVPGIYSPTGTLPVGFVPTAGGTFAFDNGSGGKDVGHFNVSINAPAVLNWTNQASINAVTRTQGVNVTWSGGASGSFVGITGGSTATSGGTSYTVSFSCVAPVSAGQFTVPANVLLALPAGAGSLSVTSSGNIQTFGATGLDVGFATASSGTSKSLNYN